MRDSKTTQWFGSSENLLLKLHLSESSEDLGFFKNTITLTIFLIGREEIADSNGPIRRRIPCLEHVTVAITWMHRRLLIRCDPIDLLRSPLFSTLTVSTLPLIQLQELLYAMFLVSIEEHCEGFRSPRKTGPFAAGSSPLLSSWSISRPFFSSNEVWYIAPNFHYFLCFLSFVFFIYSSTRILR